MDISLEHSAYGALREGIQTAEEGGTLLPGGAVGQKRLDGMRPSSDLGVVSRDVEDALLLIEEDTYGVG